MSSSSGGDLRACKSPAPNKIKPSLTTNRTSDSSFTTVISRKNLRKLNSNLLTPPSPGLQQIINNTPILNTSQSAFNYITDNNSSADPVINNGLSTDNLNDSTSNSLPDVNSTQINTSILSTDLPNDINMSSQYIQQTFSPDYNGPVVILVECIDLEKNLGNWHPIKAAKFFSTHFTGITNIKSAGSKKIKISFDSITNANLCLTSDVLLECGFTATIPSNLIFSFGIIRLDSEVLEDDFLDGVQSCFPIVSFKRISVKKDGNMVATRIVELKFLSPKLPQHISIYNMIFDVKPSIRSPVQCNRCLRFGHTQKFCRSDPRCSHCGTSKHSISECPTVHTTDPSCIFCKLPHLATDRSCKEWSIQKDIKKIMATENISFKDAIDFKKNKCYSTANTFSDVVKSQPPISEILKPNSTLREDSFPSLHDNHHFFNSGKQKHKARPSFNKKYNYSVFENQSHSPNGNYLNKLPNLVSSPVNNSGDLSWVQSLSHKLSETLINSPSLSTPFSSTSLQSLIESSIYSLFNSPFYNLTA